MNLRPTRPFTRLFSGPAEPDHLFLALSEQLDEALLLVHRDSGLIAEVNHAATVLTGFPRAELCSLSLSELFGAEAAPQVLEEIRRFRSPVARTLRDVPFRTYSGRPILADLKLALVDEGPIRPLLIIFAWPAQPRLEAERRAQTLPALLQGMLTMAELSLEPGEDAMGNMLRVGMTMMSAHACGVYLVAFNPPRLSLTDSVDLPSAFPADLTDDAASALAGPVAWSNAIRPDSPLSRAARSAGWGAMLAHPMGEGPARLGVIFFGYRAGETPPTEGALVLRLFAQQMYLLIRHMARSAGIAQTQARLHYNTGLLETLLAQTRDAIVVVNARYRVASANAIAETMFGYTAKELQDFPMQDVLISPDDLQSAVHAALARGEVSESQEIQLHRRNGEVFPAAVRVAPLYSAPGSTAPDSAVLLIGDISKRKAMETLGKQLEQRALLGDWSAIMSHEVRNPLNNISLGLQVLSSHLRPDTPEHEKATKLLAECDRLDRLMKDVLDFSKPFTPEIAPHDLGAIVTRLLARWSGKISRQRIVVHTELRPDTPMALVDPRTIEQVLANLVENAIHAMPEGGTLSVKLSPGEPTSQGPAVALKIADTGSGMTDEIKRRAFEAFYSTKEERGTGLGLAITKHIVNMHNGSITVESFVGIGSSFFITLPAAC